MRRELIVPACLGGELTLAKGGKQAMRLSTMKGIAVGSLMGMTLGAG